MSNNYNHEELITFIATIHNSLTISINAVLLFVFISTSSILITINTDNTFIRMLVFSFYSIIWLCLAFFQGMFKKHR